MRGPVYRALRLDRVRRNVVDVTSSTKECGRCDIDHVRRRRLVALAGAAEHDLVPRRDRRAAAAGVLLARAGACGSLFGGFRRGRLWCGWRRGRFRLGWLNRRGGLNRRGFYWRLDIERGRVRLLED